MIDHYMPISTCLYIVVLAIMTPAVTVGFSRNSCKKQRALYEFRKAHRSENKMRRVMKYPVNPHFVDLKLLLSQRPISVISSVRISYCIESLSDARSNKAVLDRGARDQLSLPC